MKIGFDDRGLVPAVVQDARTGEVLMLAYMNAESLARTEQSGQTVFWSRSRQELWHKGATSGNVQAVRALYADCDGDALLVQVEPAGPACHKGTHTCFDGAPAPPLAELAALERTITARKAAPQEGSYTSELLADPERRHQKVTEEAGELVVASLLGKREAVVREAADLVYHALVLLAGHDLTLADVARELGRRRK